MFLGTPLVIHQQGKSLETVVHCMDFGYVDSGGLTYWCLRGDLSDGASIPDPLQRITGHAYRNPQAAFLHDSSYIHCQHTRKLVDGMFKEALIESGAGPHKAGWFYRAVRWFGRGAWSHQDSEDASRFDLIPRQILNIPSSLLVPKDYLPRLERARLKALAWQSDHVPY